jgi:hypothetical protein
MGRIVKKFDRFLLQLLKYILINLRERFLMWLSPIFERFVEKSPVTIIVRAMMEVILATEKLDELFSQTAQTGYTRELLFSTLVNMMTQVVCSMRVLHWRSLQSDVRRNRRVENRRL